MSKQKEKFLLTCQQCRGQHIEEDTLFHMLQTLPKRSCIFCGTIGEMDHIKYDPETMELPGKSEVDKKIDQIMEDNPDFNPEEAMDVITKTLADLSD